MSSLKPSEKEGSSLPCPAPPSLDRGLELCAEVWGGGHRGGGQMEVEEGKGRRRGGGCKRAQSKNSNHVRAGRWSTDPAPGSGGSERSSNLLKATQLSIGLRKERWTTEGEWSVASEGWEQLEEGKSYSKQTPTRQGWCYPGGVWGGLE